MWKSVLPKAQTGRITVPVKIGVIFGGSKRFPPPTSAAISSYFLYDQLPQKIPLGFRVDDWAI